MLMMNKKIISLISFSSALIIGGSSIVASFAIKNDNDSIDPKPNNNPLERDETYHNYKIGNRVIADENFNNIIKKVTNKNNYFYVIDETEFIKNISLIVRSVLKEIDIFSKNYNLYKIECNYKISTSNILIDIVWYMNINDQKKYYDQFQISLLTY